MTDTPDARELAAWLRMFIEGVNVISSDREGLRQILGTLQAAAALDADGWWPIEEVEKCYNMRPVDLWHKDGHRLVYCVWDEQFGVWRDTHHHSFEPDEITHFRLLPKPPSKTTP